MKFCIKNLLSKKKIMNIIRYEVKAEVNTDGFLSKIPKSYVCLSFPLLESWRLKLIKNYQKVLQLHL